LGTEEGEIDILAIAVREHGGGRFAARALVSSEKDEDLILAGSTGERVPAREHEAVGAPRRRACRNRHTGSTPETLPVPLEHDLDRGRQNPLDDLLAAGFPEAADGTP
jgi:hypothetical protein